MRGMVLPVLAVMGALCSGCGSSSTVTPTVSGSQNPQSQGSGKASIQHIVVIVQENRTVDNIFNGFPGADTAQTGTTSSGQTVSLTPRSMADPVDISHSHVNFERQYARGNMYFDRGVSPAVTPTYPYSYVPRSETKPLWDIASQFTLGDRMFQSNNGPSFPAHLYLISGQSNLVDGNPIPSNLGHWGCDSEPGSTAPLLGTPTQDAPGPFPCYDFPTIADELDAHNLTWRYYSPRIGMLGGVWSAYDAIRHIRYGRDWNNVVSPETKILSDVNGSLPSVTWVTPSLENSDHAGSRSASGPQWVASVVNAIGNSPNWNSTAILITWDDWGGWYDHVVPPQLDSMGLGFRVPLLVVSPYAKHGYVSHVQHEFGSILRFIEKTYGLPSLTHVDARADDLSDCFNLSQAPRPFHAIATKVSARQLLSMRADNRSPDDDE